MKKMLLTLLAGSLGLTSFAQTAASYAFSTSTGTYASVSGTGTTIPSVAGDDMTAPAIPIGFSFSFCGTAYTTVTVCSNGWVALGTSTSTSFNNMLSTVSSISPALMPFWDDLNGTGGTAYYQTTGTSPNRVFTMEYSNWSFYAVFGSAGNFQVKLHETSNVIDFCYGANTFIAATTATIGIATSATDYQTVDTTATPSSASFVTNVNTLPASGRTYSWTPSAACTGTPSTGYAAATLTYSCAANYVSLTLSGYSTGGVTYQWQSSADGITWANIPGATNTTYGGGYTATSTTYYQCVSTCTGSGMTATSYSTSVTPDLISGTITATGGIVDSTNKVWLIYFNPADSSLTAVDSTLSCYVSATTQYYSFAGKPAGTYMAKAKDLASVAGTSGYVPTYSLSTPYWSSAATAAHAGGYDVLNINMIYGTVPSGPGFIGGLIVSGAGKHTSADVPVVGMSVLLRNASGTVLTYTYTDASGAYSFSGIANGTYTIYPEDLGFLTTPSADVVLATGSESATAINFKEHTTFKTVTPYTGPTSVPVTPAVSIAVYPNPASNTLYIAGNGLQVTTASVVIKDITGRVVGTEQVSLSATAHIDISTLANGVYFACVATGDATYNVKFSVQK